ncbi:MAG: alpha-mannosidase [Candidatus Lokiarchaeota archaeon]|nr:alpha-mannosidase [Candidatus Lokiarchaeota archaeon]
MSTSLGTIDSPKMRGLFKFLHKTKLSILLVLALKGVIERMGKGFKFRRLNMIAVGQSHLDAAWRWRKKQTILKARATFSKAIGHMRAYPGFTFAQTSPAYYAWMKQHFPALYADIKEAVRRGQWLPFGGMWVEPDLNIPSGEALVRQRLYGMRFFKDEFGKMPDIEFCQDTFGFNWALPQILAKSGARMFGTGKIFWNDTNDFPIGMFHWRAPDGTLLPTLLMHFGYFLPVNYGKRYPDIYRLMAKKARPGVDYVFDYRTPLKQIRQVQSKELMLDTVFGYGLGDGGHGPIEAEMVVVSAIRLLFPKRFRYCREGDFFKHFAPHLDRWATWNTEIYLELHRGVLTTNALAKRYNRKLEIMLEGCEVACVLASLLGSPYPRDRLSSCWKAVLFNQFHDILPGSSIFEVYRDAFQDYEDVQATLGSLLQGALSRVGAAVRSHGSKAGRFLVAYNPLAWPRHALVEVPAATMAAVDDPGLLDEGSGAVQVTRSGSYIVPVDVAAASVAQISAETASAAGKLLLRTSNDLRVGEGDADITLENERILCVIDKRTGYLKSVKNKETGVEGLSGPGNRILLFGDDPKRYPPWEIDGDYLNKPVTVDDACKSITVIERGPLRCGVEVVHVHDRSTFVQRIFLQAGDDLLRFSMDVDWHQQKTLFKLGFPVATAGDEVVSDIPYACIPRPIVPKTPHERARWEYSCHKWIDVSDGKDGFGLLNDCKYGFSMAGDEIRLTVLNSPVYAGYAKETMFVDRGDPSIPAYVDQFRHEGIQYAIHVHRGDWRAGTWRKAIELNAPITSTVVDAPASLPTGGGTGGALGLVSCTPEHVVVAAFKVWEDEPDLAAPSTFIARVVEMAGKGHVEARICLPRSVRVAGAELVDMLELAADGSRPVRVSGSEIALEVGPHEIATLRIRVDRGD